MENELDIKQTLFILSNSKLVDTDLTPRIKATLFFSEIDKEETNLPLFIANFPYLAMGKIKIPKKKRPPLINISLNSEKPENFKIEKKIKPRFSSVISIYISNTSSKPDLEEFKSLYKLFLAENQNSIKIPSKESLKACRSFILKKSAFSYFAPFFLAASYYLTDPISIQYVQIYSQLRINGRTRSFNELIDFSNALYTFLVRAETRRKLIRNQDQVSISINYNDDENYDNNNNNNDDSMNIVEDQILFLELIKGTISDVLNDLEKAELHGPHSSILFLACIYTDSFQNQNFILPKKWHFLPMELVNRNKNDQKHTGRFISDNLSFIEASICNNLLSAISCYSPLFHNDIKVLVQSMIRFESESKAVEALIFTCLKLQQINTNKTNFIYLYSIKNYDYVKKLWEIVSMFKCNYIKEFESSIEFNTSQQFNQLFHKIISHFIPDEEILSSVFDDNNNCQIKDRDDDSDNCFYQQFYDLYLKDIY